MAKKDYKDCFEMVEPIKEALCVLSGKWKLPIIISISAGNERFTDIQNSILDLSPKALAKELKELEQNIFIRRIITNSYPVKVFYKVEGYASTLTPIMYALKDWGLNHRLKVVEIES